MTFMVLVIDEIHLPLNVDHDDAAANDLHLQTTVGPGNFLVLNTDDTIIRRSAG